VIIAASASKAIRLLLIPGLGSFPKVIDWMERVNQQKQQARHNNKKRARTNLGGSFGSPSSFKLPACSSIPPFPASNPDSMLESAAFLRPAYTLASHFVKLVISPKQCLPC
jgi:hypothetical protein